MAFTRLVRLDGVDGQYDPGAGVIEIDPRLSEADRAEVERQLRAAIGDRWDEAPHAHRPPPNLRVIRGGQCDTPDRDAV